MAKIVRKPQKIFGSTAGLNQIAQFGSLAAAAPAFTTDPTVIQALSNYLDGWFSAVIGSNSPTIEDMNALFYLFAYQLSYVMQEGVPEWDSATTYYKGSLAQDGASILYISLTDNNLNNALTSSANWQVFFAGLSKDTSDLDPNIVASGYTYTKNNLIIQSGKTLTVSGTLVSGNIDELSGGSLIDNGLVVELY